MQSAEVGKVVGLIVGASLLATLGVFPEADLWPQKGTRRHQKTDRFSWFFVPLCGQRSLPVGSSQECRVQAPSLNRTSRAQAPSHNKPPSPARALHRPAGREVVPQLWERACTRLPGGSSTGHANTASR